jgi:hypothetical protein
MALFAVLATGSECCRLPEIQSAAWLIAHPEVERG